MAEALKSLTQFDEHAKIGESRNPTLDDITGPMRRDKAFPRTRREVLHRERQALALFVDAGDERLDFLIFLENILRMLDLFGPRNVRHVDKPVDTFFKLY